MTVEDASGLAQRGEISPRKLAHVVLRTSRFEKLKHWYLQVLNAHVVHEDEGLCFMTYDDEHHRIAIMKMDDLADQQRGVAGVHHVAFTYACLGDLLLTFERLSQLNIKPVLSINHGPTTSLYYQDPDFNQIEMQVDNYNSVEGAANFFQSHEFAANPLGIVVSPDDLLERLRAGVSEAELLIRPVGPAPRLADFNLR